ncbi:hypothetical protein HHL17_09025 [Chitinophaga sp. G-6-1-13]|uniref:DUF4397 domain-containing protein n=1 Tax=Chitinophaga fulva TaxID=2728842 RepID=A0A848GIV9_9BACT|nr:hypothetical protein [Chitinophaga fulva]NML37339.1 hypothetical protein [Chitinophaga fulva]
MKSLQKHISIIAVLLCILFTACNKEDLQAEKAMQIIINGYNGNNNALQVSIDTTSFGPSVAGGKYIVNPSSLVSFNTVYTYPVNRPQAVLTLTDMETKAVVFSKPLPATGTKANFNFIYIDGKELAINPPATDPATNKLGFYLRYTGSDAAFDIFLYRQDAATGKEYRAYLAKNVNPNTWIYPDYVPSADFDDKNELRSANIHFTLAGTTDQWAFNDNENDSKISAFGMGFPLTGEKGLVQSYFLAHSSSQLERSCLFFQADRPW